MALPESFDLVDTTTSVVIGHGIANERWVVLDYFTQEGAPEAQATMTPAEFEQVRRTMPQFGHINVVAT